MKRFVPLVVAVLLAPASACDGGGYGDSPTPAPTAVVVPATDGWTMLGSDRAAAFRNTAERAISVEGARGRTVAWAYDAGGFVASTPAVVDGRVYAVSARGAFALGAATGAEIWRNPTLGGTASPA